MQPAVPSRRKEGFPAEGGNLGGGGGKDSGRRRKKRNRDRESRIFQSTLWSAPIVFKEKNLTDEGRRGKKKAERDERREREDDGMKKAALCTYRNQVPQIGEKPSKG